MFFFSTFSFMAVQAQEPVLYAKDSVVEPATDATIRFFQENEKAGNASQIMLVTKNKVRINLASMLQKLGPYGDHALADLDYDGKKELLLYNYTGGAHCCDAIYIFKNTTADKYQQVAKLFAGNTVIGDSNKFYYNFHESFGYFFTCFACVHEDTADEAPIRTSRIALKYKNGIVSTSRGDQELRSRINDNLAKLGEMPYQKLDDEQQQDDGLRKEVALNLAVFYFKFGKNLNETQRLFNKYYKFPDAKKVWAEFVKTLNNVKKDSDL